MSDSNHWARIVDGLVRETVPFDPEGRYPVEWLWIACGADVRQGATYDARTGKFTNPLEPGPVEPAPAEPVYRTRVSQKEYYGLFRPDEEALIRIVASEPITAADLKGADAAERTRLMRVASLAVMLRRTDALSPDGIIDLADHQVEDGLGLLTAMDLLAADRPAEIRRGVPA